MSVTAPGEIAAIVLDMDGLMLDTEKIYKIAWQQSAADLGYQLGDPFYMTLVGRPTEECERSLVEVFGPEFPLTTFQADWRRQWRAAAEYIGVAPKPGLERFLSFAETEGLQMAVATSSYADFANYSLQRAGLIGRIPVVVTRDQVANGKPSPDLYLEAARRMHVPPSRCVALEDSDPGVLSACAAGMTTICIPDLKPPSDAAARSAFRVVASLDDARTLIAEMVARAPTSAAPLDRGDH